MVTAKDVKTGMTVEYEGNLCQIIDFQHVKPGKGAAFVRIKYKKVITGGVVETSFRPEEDFKLAHIDRKDMQYLYTDGDLYYFMDPETFDQVGLNSDVVGDSLKFVKEQDIVSLSSYNGNVFLITPPISVSLVVTDTEPGFKGDTATGASKPATVETGATIAVPLFIEIGEKIKIDTRTGEYTGRDNT